SDRKVALALTPPLVLLAVDANPDRLVLHDRTATAAPGWNEARVPAGVAATQRDQNILWREPAGDISSFDQPMGVRAVLLFVFAGAVLTHTSHALDRALSMHEEVGLRLLTAPASVGENAHVLRREDHHALAKRDATIARHGVSDRAQH